MLSARSFDTILKIVYFQQEELKKKRRLWAKRVIQRFIKKWWKWLLFNKDYIREMYLHHTFDLEDENNNWSAYVFHQYRKMRDDYEEGLMELTYRSQERY